MDPQWLQKAFDSNSPTVKIPATGLQIGNSIPITFTDEFIILFQSENRDFEVEAKDVVILVLDGVEHRIDLDHPNKNLTAEFIGKTISNALAWRKDSNTGPEKRGELRIAFTDGSLLIFPSSPHKSAWQLEFKRNKIRSSPAGDGLEYAVHKPKD
ncbi:hypothetical protein JW859_01190 [bacterium]|nr:hypothetical protein [bacterium]